MSLTPTHDEKTALNRLILLYLLDKLQTGTTDMHIAQVLIESHLMDYFTIQENLAYLLANNLATKSFTDEERFVHFISDAGKDVLNNLYGNIPIGIRKNIDNLVISFRYQIRKDNQITADYTPESENSFIVTCAASEDDFSLIKIDVQIGTREDSIDVCHNWKTHSQEIYSEIIESLVKKRD